MNRLTFVQLHAENKYNCETFEQLMRKYIKEFDEHRNKKPSNDFIEKYIKSIIQIQGDSDRHLELCYNGKTLIGFLYGQINHSEHKGLKKVGYGYIKEFFVLPEHRRNGYGRKMYLHLEKAFRKDGAKRLYLTSDSNTGIPFWKSMGFTNTGKKSPENNLDIYEKKLLSYNSRAVKIIKYPDDAMLSSLAREDGKIADKITNGLTHVISTAHYRSDFFCTVMYSGDEVIGFADFIQNSSEPSKWLYSDLWIASEYRRQGCATELVNTGLQHLSELNARTLLCTVDPLNEASLNLQKSLGFEQIETQPFEFLGLDGLIMFKLNIQASFNIVSLSDNLNHLLFICNLLTHPSNASALHLKTIPDDEILRLRIEMRETLIFKAPEDEVNYIIRKGVVPIAWLKLNGLTDDSLWISMLVVHEKYRNIGVGMFALNFVEKFALSTKRNHIYINTTSDNIIAKSLYKKVGYTVVKEENHQNEDETVLVRLTFHKEIF